MKHTPNAEVFIFLLRVYILLLSPSPKHLRLLEPSPPIVVWVLRIIKEVPAVGRLQDVSARMLVTRSRVEQIQYQTYLAIASRNRDLYSFGLVTVGRLRPPPANPRSLIQLSSFLSHVYVRIQSMIPTTSSLRASSTAIISE